jgi:excisionase family DNA binding protein
VDPVTVPLPTAANALGVSKSTVQRRINDGKLKTILLGGRRLVLVSSIKSLVADLAQ